MVKSSTQFSECSSVALWELQHFSIIYLSSTFPPTVSIVWKFVNRLFLPRNFYFPIHPFSPRKLGLRTVCIYYILTYCLNLNT